jgi:hypothetical protein
MDGVWVEKFSKTHKKKYYFNRETKETSWINPIETQLGVQLAAEKKVENIKNEKNETVQVSEFVSKVENENKVIAQSAKKESELSLLEFLMNCLQNEVSMEFDWESRYSDDRSNPKNKKIFSYYLVTNVPYLVKEIQYEYGVVALLSITDTHLPISHDILKKLCGFKPFYEFNLASFAAFLGVQTPYAMSQWRETVWRTVYKPIFEQMKLPSADSWDKLSRVRVTLCTSTENPGGYLFVRELQEFLKYVSNIR